jgi:predicted metal-binding membrane protein
VMDRQAPVAQPRAAALPASGWLRFGTAQLTVALALLVTAGLAWIVTAQRMSGMDAGPWTDPGTLGFYLSAWILMMTAMMLPALTPAALGYAALVRARRARARSARTDATALFVGGYLAVWGVSGLVGYAVLEGGRSLDGGVLGWDRGGRWVATAVLLVAAVYQLTPAKAACLSRCREARASADTRLGESSGGALLLGARHGAWCVGCCWALMAALFALGAMSVAWMVVISLLIAAERLLPWRRLTAIGVGSVLAALTIGLAAAPTRVPMLTIPGSPAAAAAMGMSPTPGSSMGAPPTHPPSSPTRSPMAPLTKPMR